MGRFVEDVNTRRRMFFLFFLNLGAVSKNTTPGNFTYILHFKRVGIIATTFEKRKFISIVMFSLPSPSSTLLKSSLLPSRGCLPSCRRSFCRAFYSAKMCRRPGKRKFLLREVQNRGHLHTGLLLSVLLCSRAWVNAIILTTYTLQFFKSFS